jgi:hypothetical protein
MMNTSAGTKSWFASWARAASHVAVLVSLLVCGSAAREAQAQPEARSKSKARSKPKRVKPRDEFLVPPPVGPEVPDIEFETPRKLDETPSASSGSDDLPWPPQPPSKREPAQSEGRSRSGEPALPPGLEGGGESPATTGRGEPALPPGLEGGGESPAAAGSGEPALPPGLGGESESSAAVGSGEPGLPPGLGGGGEHSAVAGGGDGGLDGSSAAEGAEGSAGATSFFDVLGLTGFIDLRHGVRVQDDPFQDWTTLAEVRLQLSLEKSFFDSLTFKATSDFLLDSVAREEDIDLERGRGPIDLREASLSFTPFSFLDLKLGRQTLTWGTADFVFLNDLFPKDFQAFFLGRDMRYLKAPSDAAKVSLFTPVANLDVVAAPRFNPDRFITGERLSYFNPQLMQLAGQNAVIEAERPDDWIDDGELHARLSLNAGSVELAAYGYRGYWKSPGGFNMTTGKATFPRLNVFGGSFRDKLFSGITNIEVAYYHSLEDKTGDNVFVNNSEARLVVGYERQFPGLSEGLTLWAQYYLEYLPHYDAYLSTLPEGFPAREEFRHLVTLRITQLLFGQNMNASLVTVYSPSDRDGYVRPSIGYRVADCCSVTVGGNFFFGDKDYTFLYQLQNNANAYAALQYGF